MSLYHAGFLALPNPDVHDGRRNADFGQGFYLTPEKEFALRWAKERKGEESILNKYEFDPSGLTIHRFTKDADWYSYIFSNRRGKADSIGADVIIGPIANDTIYDTVGIITSGFLTDDQALQLLLLGPEYTQITLKTEKAAEHLIWKEARKIEPDEILQRRAAVKAEEDDYWRAIGETMDKF